MTAKILTSFGCLLLLAAVLAPSVVGHSERAVFAGDLGSGYTGAGAGLANTVSGRYVGAAGPAVAIEAYANAQGTLASGAMLCDAEVVVDDPTFPGNEDNVDGNPTGTGVADVWDDGGLGGACHTNHYSTPGWNTFGCQGGAEVRGGNHGGLDIWVGASCDWKTDTGGTSSSTTLTLCITNSILALTPDPAVIVAEVLTIVQCVLDFIACLLDPTCGATGAVQSCGADGSSDAIVFGYAKATAGRAAVFPANGGIVNAPPGFTGPCSTAGTDDTAGIFVWDTVATNGGGVNNPGNVQVYAAASGEVFTVANSNAVPPLLPPCQNANAGTPVVVQTACTHPTYGVCAPWVSVWNFATSTRVNSCSPFAPVGAVDA